MLTTPWVCAQKGPMWRKSDAMNILQKLEILTRHEVFYRITNLVIEGLDQNNQPRYKPQYQVTLGQRGNELFMAIDTTLGKAVNTAFEWARDNKLVQL